MAQDKNFAALLKSDGISKGPIQLTSIGLQFQRDTGSDGRPTSMVYGGTLSLNATLTNKTFLVETMLNKSNKAIPSGKIEITTTASEGIYRTIEFTNGYITNYQESFDLTGDTVMSCSFTISAEKVKVEKAELNLNWPKTT